MCFRDEKDEKLRVQALRSECIRLMMACVDGSGLSLLEDLVERYCVVGTGEHNLGCLGGSQEQEGAGVASQFKKDDSEDVWFALKIVGGVLAAILAILYYAAVYVGYYTDM